MQVIRKEELRKVQRQYGVLTVLASPKETRNAVKRTDIKTLEIRPGARTSSHYHLLAESVFWVISGEIDAIETGGTLLRLGAGDVLVVPPREQHCIVNRGTDVAIVIETQSPPYAVWDTFPSEKQWLPPKARNRKGAFWEASATASIRVKVCGVRSLDAAIMCEENGVAAIGINLTSESKGLRALDQWLDWIPHIPEALSVFVLTDSHSCKEVETLVKICNADTVQIQGNMPVDTVCEVSQFCKNNGIRTVKSIGLEAGQDGAGFAYLDKIQEHVDAVLLDSSWRGGTGLQASMESIKATAVRAKVPLILAGGLTSSNVAEALRLSNASAVDVESGVEVRVGISAENQRGIAVKSAEKVRAFMNALKQVSGNLSST